MGQLPPRLARLQLNMSMQIDMIWRFGCNAQGG
jgi:hypothetical protein